MNMHLPHVVDNLRRDGISLVDPLTSGEIADINSHLANCQVYDAHVKVHSKQSLPNLAAAVASRWPAITVDMHDVVTAPHLLEAGMESMPIAREYFGEEPLLYSMNVFWTHPSDIHYHMTHGWHADGDDRKQLVLFVYGTDVEREEDGAHMYSVGSHGGIAQPYTGQPVNPRTILGPAGTSFMCDTTGFHQGLRPNKLRMLLWARWGVTCPPDSYVWDKLSPVPRERLGDRYPSEEALQRAIRLVVS